MNLPRAVPLVFQPGSFIFNIQCLIYSLVLLGSRPNHFNLAPLTLSPNCSTLAGSLMCSFLILSILVTSHKNLLYLYFWHFQLSLLSFGRRFCLQNSHESSQERRLRLRRSWHGSKRETRSSLKRTQSVNTKRNRVPFLSVHLSKKWGLVLVKGEYNKKNSIFEFLLTKKKEKKNNTQNFLFLPWRGSMKHKCVIKVDSSGTGHIQRQRQHFTLTFTPMIDSEETLIHTDTQRTYHHCSCSEMFAHSCRGKWHTGVHTPGFYPYRRQKVITYTVVWSLTLDLQYSLL